MRLLDVYKYIANLSEEYVPVRGIFIRADAIAERDFRPTFGWNYSDILADDWVFIPESSIARLFKYSSEHDADTFMSFVDEYGVSDPEDMDKMKMLVRDKKVNDDYDLKDTLLRYIHDMTKDSYDDSWDDLMSYEREDVWAKMGWHNVENLELPRKLSEEEKNINPDVLYAKNIYKALTFKEAVFSSLVPDILACLKDKSVFVDVEEYSPYKLLLVGTGQTKKK